MTMEEPSAGLEERLRQLIELRKKEEAEYGKLLTELDRICTFPLPHETQTRFPEIKDSLNRIWDVSENALSAAQSESRYFWKEVANSVTDYLHPFLHHQREVNSALVHLLNEYVNAVTESLKQIRTFQNTLILYFQKIIPVIDTKFRESVGLAETFRIGLKDNTDLLFQELDKKIQALEVDSESLAGLIPSAVQQKNKTGPESYSKFFIEEPVLDLSDGNLREQLLAQNQESLAGILCPHSVETLSPRELMHFLKMAHSCLKPNGVLFVEAINVSSAEAFLNQFLADPNHRTALHPDTLRFLLQSVGFEDVQILFTSAVPSAQKLKLLNDSGDEQTARINQNIEKLNRLLFSDRKYAVVAKK